MKNKRGLPIRVFMLLFILCLHVAYGRQAQDNRIAEVNDNPAQIQERLLYYINQERVARGIPSLTDDTEVGIVALNHSAKMAYEKKLSHVFPGYPSLGERLMQAGIFFMKFGENVAYSDTPVATLIHKELMDSPEHRANILDPDYSHCAIRVVENNGTFFVTQNFTRLYSPHEPSIVEDQLKKEIDSWFKTPLLHDKQWDHFARQCSQLRTENSAINDLIRNAPPQWGQFHVHHLMTPDIEEVKKILKEKLQSVHLAAIGIGVTFTRNPEYPGGAYSVTFMLFRNTHHGKSPGQLANLVLQQINQKRSNNGLNSLTMDTKLSQEALEISKIAFLNPGSPPQLPNPDRNLQAYFYQTDQLEDIPGFVSINLDNPKYKASIIGIGVFLPLNQELAGNFFLITLIAR